MTDPATTDEVLKDAEQRMARSVQVYGKELEGMRTGRANPAMLDSLRVDYYGTPTPINQLATVAVPEPRMLTIQPWDRQVIGAIEKAVLKSDLGLTPATDGQLIRLPIPSMTQERRQQMVKRLHHMREETHIAIRNVRRDALEHLRRIEKAHAISEDDLRRAQERLQKGTDSHISGADALTVKKEKELVEV